MARSPNQGRKRLAQRSSGAHRREYARRRPLFATAALLPFAEMMLASGWLRSLISSVWTCAIDQKRLSSRLVTGQFRRTPSGHDTF